MHKIQHTKLHPLEIAIIALFSLIFLSSNGPFTNVTQKNSKPANLRVSANVVSSCTISDEDMKFSRYDQNKGVTGQGELKVTCSKDVKYSVGLDKGDEQYRDLDNGKGSEIKYDLYQDKAQLVPWGDDLSNDGSKALVKTGIGTEEVIKVYGNIPKGQKMDENNSGYTDNDAIEFQILE